MLSNIPTTEQPPHAPPHPHPPRHSGHKNDLKWIKLPSWSCWPSCSDSRLGGEELFAPVGPSLPRSTSATSSPPISPRSVISPWPCCHLLQQVFFFFSTPVDTRKNELRTCNLEEQGDGGGGGIKQGFSFALQSVLLTDQLQRFSLGGAAPAWSGTLYAPLLCRRISLVSIAMTPLLPHSLLPGRHDRGDSVSLKNFSSLQLPCQRETFSRRVRQLSLTRRR